MKLLEGEFEEITAMDFRKSPGDFLTQAAMGKTFRITRNGQPIAMLTEPTLTALEVAVAVRKLHLIGN